MSNVSSASALRARLAAAGLDWITPDWDRPDGVLVATTTRPGTDEANYLHTLLPSPPVRLTQVHGAGVAVLDTDSIQSARAAPPVADAAVTRVRGVVCAVATADCLPVVLTDKGGDTIGIAHAGWRGLAAGVLESTVRAMRELSAEAGQLSAWFGPAIGPAAFEVGLDVFTAFCDADAGAQTCFVPHREGKWHANLYALARRRLAACGVHDVSGGELCTYSDPTRFFSYRRQRAAGRMTTLAWLTTEPGDATL